MELSISNLVNKQRSALDFSKSLSSLPANSSFSISSTSSSSHASSNGIVYVSDRRESNGCESQQRYPVFHTVPQSGIFSMHQKNLEYIKNKPRACVNKPVVRLDQKYAKKAEKLNRSKTAMLYDDDSESSAESEDYRETQRKKKGGSISCEFEGDDGMSSESEEAGESDLDFINDDILDSSDDFDAAVIVSSGEEEEEEFETEESEEDDENDENEGNEEEIDFDQNISPGIIEAEEISEREFGWEVTLPKYPQLARDFKNMSLYHVIYYLIELITNEFTMDVYPSIDLHSYDGKPQLHKYMKQSNSVLDISQIEDPYLLACVLWERLFRHPVQILYQKRHRNNKSFQMFLEELDVRKVVEINKVGNDCTRPCMFNKELPADYAVSFFESKNVYYLSSKHLGYLETLLRFTHFEHYIRDFFRELNDIAIEEKIRTDEGKSEFIRRHTPYAAHSVMTFCVPYLIKKKMIAQASTRLLTLLN